MLFKLRSTAAGGVEDDDDDDVEGGGGGDDGEDDEGDLGAGWSFGTDDSSETEGSLEDGSVVVALLLRDGNDDMVW